MCSLGVKAVGFSWLTQQKEKDTPQKQIMIDFCYWNMVSVMSDDSYDEGFMEDDIFE